jgi:branched-chain amino acid transport system substrate-binding protein
MNRRRFLGFLAGTTAALAAARAVSAQTRGPAVPIAPVAPRPVPLGGAPAGPPAGPGVSASEIRIGMSAAFRGTAAGLGTEFYRGAQAYYDETNLRGGVHGRHITTIALNDSYEPNPCIKNTIQLLEKEQVFALSNYVGTPTLTRALPVMKRYA